MTKTYAIALFGTQAELARALGISPQAVDQWPDDLKQGQIDRVIGASVRLGRIKDMLAIRVEERPPDA